MKAFISISAWMLFWIIVIGPASLPAQVLTNQASIHLLPGATLTVQGGLTNDTDGSITNDGLMTVEGDLINHSLQNLSDGQGVVQLTGDSSQQIIGGNHRSRFFDLIIANTGAGIVLQQDIEVDNQMRMDSGNVNLNGQTIFLGDTAKLVNEADHKRIYGLSGEIETTRYLDSLTGMNIANLGIELTSSTNLGSTRIARGHTVQSIGAGSSIERYFHIIPDSTINALDLDASMRMYYFPSELNGQNPVYLNFFGLRDGATNWSPAWGDSDLSTHSVVQSGLESMLMWTLSDDGITGIHDPRPGLSVSMYPNPLISGQSLSLTGLEAGTYELLVFDMRGRQVLGQRLTAYGSGESIQVPFPLLASGMYTIQMLSQDFRPMLGKLLIQAH